MSSETTKPTGDTTTNQPAKEITLAGWYKRAKKTFNRFHHRSAKAILAENDEIEFDGNTSVLGKVIEAWAITVIGENSNPSEVKLGKLILTDYFSGRYQRFTDGDGENSKERGYNLNGEVYYSIKEIRSRSIIDKDTGENFISAVKIFRDYDRSPKTFGYGSTNT